MGAFVIDTNVLLIADRQHDSISTECYETCVLRLSNWSAADRVVLDDQFEIVREYRHKLDPKGGKTVAQAFLKALLQDPARRLLVSLTPEPTRGYHTFPDDPDLAHFDPADRKFVAAAVASPEPTPILQAADCKWLGWAPALQRHGLRLEFLCPQDLARFAANKGLTPT